MGPAFRSRGAGFVMVALLAVQMGCTTIQHVPVNQNPTPTEISGVTTMSGTVVEFEPKGAIISRDTLYANTKNGQVVIPRDSIRTYSMKEISTKNTIGLVLITGLVVVGFVVLANKTAGRGAY